MRFKLIPRRPDSDLLARPLTPRPLVRRDGVSLGPGRGYAVVVTVTNPAGDQTLLQTVIRTEHQRLGSVLVEASRDTSGTPGVHDDLVRDLRLSLARHLNAEIALVHPEVGSVLEQQFVEELARDTTELEKLIGRDPRTWDLDRVDAALLHHVDLYENLLSELRESVGDRRMATLGYEFGRAAESAPGRPLQGGGGGPPSGDSGD